MAVEEKKAEALSEEEARKERRAEDDRIDAVVKRVTEETKVLRSLPLPLSQAFRDDRQALIREHFGDEDPLVSLAQVSSEGPMDLIKVQENSGWLRLPLCGGLSIEAGDTLVLSGEITDHISDRAVDGEIDREKISPALALIGVVKPVRVGGLG